MQILVCYRLSPRHGCLEADLHVVKGGQRRRAISRGSAAVPNSKGDRINISIPPYFCGFLLKLGNYGSPFFIRKFQNSCLPFFSHVVTGNVSTERSPKLVRLSLPSGEVRLRISPFLSAFFRRFFYSSNPRHKIPERRTAFTIIFAISVAQKVIVDSTTGSRVPSTLLGSHLRRESTL